MVPPMQWWNDVLDWIRSEGGWRIISGALIPFIAIVLAGVIGAGIGRGATRRLVLQREQETRAAAVSALITAGQDAAKWHSQAPAAKEHAAQLASEADIKVRLLPISGAALAADWATHQLGEMRTNSVSYSYQADQTLDEYRDRLVEWLHRPARAKKLFAADLQRWRYDQAGPDPLVLEQQKWAEDQYTATTHETPEHAPELPLGAPAATTAATAPAGTASEGTAPVTAPVFGGLTPESDPAASRA